MENAKNFIFGKFGLKIFVFEYHIITYSCILLLNFNDLSWFWIFFQKVVFFLKFSEPLSISIDPFYFSINQKFLNMFERASDCFDQSKLIFDRSNFFKNCFVKISVCFDRSRLFFDRSKLVNHVFLKVRLDFFKVTFSKLFKLSSLSLRFG